MAGAVLGGPARQGSLWLLGGPLVKGSPALGWGPATGVLGRGAMPSPDTHLRDGGIKARGLGRRNVPRSCPVTSPSAGLARVSLLSCALTGFPSQCNICATVGIPL